jgi:hypothetical protein
VEYVGKSIGALGMNRIVIVDSDQGRRNGLRIACDGPGIDIIDCQDLKQVRGLVNDSHVSALFLAWPDGGQGFKKAARFEWGPDYVVPLLQSKLTPDQIEAEAQQADDWSKQIFPQAHVKCMTWWTVGQIQRTLADVLDKPQRQEARDECPAVRNEGSGAPPLDERQARLIIGTDVQLLRLLDNGATSSVFLGIDPLNRVRVYKLASISRASQFKAVKKAVSLIWDTAEAAKYLLHATVDYCHDRNFFVIATVPLDDAAGGRFDLGSYEPKTMLRWLKSLPRYNGVLGKRHALEVLAFVASALQGLSFLHRNGIAFNDVHGGNCGFFKSQPVWIDYSAITFIGDPPHEGCGYYSAPEGREATPAHDCFSVVKMLVEALSGLHPATIQPIAICDISRKCFNGPLDVVRKIACKGLALDPDQRYKSASELARDLWHARRILAARA